MSFEYSQPSLDHIRSYAFLGGDFFKASFIDPASRHQRAQGEYVGLGLFARLFADTVKICRHAGIRNVHEVVREFVEQDEQLPMVFQPAVNRNEVPSFDAVIEAIRLQGHLDDGDLPPRAQAVEIFLGQRFFVPSAAKARYFCEEEKHLTGAALCR